MELSKQELFKLIIYCDTYRTNEERHIRRLRRNYETIKQAWDEWNDEGSIPSPDQEIEMHKQNKAEAVIIKKKLQLQMEESK